MNKARPSSTVSKYLFRLVLKYRRLLPKKRCHAFGALVDKKQPRIDHIYVINLIRQPNRLTEIKHELRHILDYSGSELWNLTERYNAVDATKFLQDPEKSSDIDPSYTLKDQLLVEPQPFALPTEMELNSPIRMSRPEIAVAQSHIGIWRELIVSNHEYVLIIEDDVWFRPNFVKNLNEGWAEIIIENNKKCNFDVLYLSYEEVKHGAPKIFLSSNIFRPVRGLWNLSGYVISRKGAEKLLQLLPCRGPVDLWLNHQFKFLDVRAIKESVISQRRDFSSTNSYSILPTLTKIGAITSESASLFHIRPSELPVFVFGAQESGLTSLAMALSMLGYKCCSDLQSLPDFEIELLFTGSNSRIFDAYVNIGFLQFDIQAIKECYPNAKFILTTTENDSDLSIYNLEDKDIAIVPKEAPNKWQIVCEFLRCAPPPCPFPELDDLGQRKLISSMDKSKTSPHFYIPKRDRSPWIVESSQAWHGINCLPFETKSPIESSSIKVDENFKCINPNNWYQREDTFTDNLALFRPSNIELTSESGAKLSVKKENLGVRQYSAASLTSNNQYLYGRFEATIKASSTPGVITGFFLHRNSPRQEIDIEIAGNRTNILLVNVFYNPGGDGANFDYGYRGAATYIDLGFDASKSYHSFAIEWTPCEIRWFVDNHLVHRRSIWDPTPIPHLPMSLHVNIWPCRSTKLAGHLSNRRLPATTFIKSITIEANLKQNSTLL